jgi:nucleoside-diphosphate-sugar epimerase
MLGLAKLKRARFLLASTSEVYGDPEVHPQPETYWGHVNAVGPRGVYDEAKRYAEALTMAYHRQQGVDSCIARIFNTYGARMRPHVDAPSLRSCARHWQVSHLRSLGTAPKLVPSATSTISCAGSACSPRATSTFPSTSATRRR